MTIHIGLLKGFNEMDRKLYVCVYIYIHIFEMVWVYDFKKWGVGSMPEGG